jgi:predicted AlkP superfamily phosphohydrolase/phosphomutase
MQKLLLIGLDGATWDVLMPLIKEGKLPTLKKLVENGVHGIVESTIPPVTGGAWVSLATGKTPGKTGIIDFLNRKDESYRLYPTNSEDFKGHSFWDYLSKVGKKVGIFNYPMLFPPYKINGFMVSGLGASPEDEITYPLSLKQELEQIVGKYEIYVDYHDEKYNDLDLFIQDLNTFLNKFEKVVYHVVRNKKWNILFLVFSVTDWVQHIMWNHIDENHPLHNSKVSPKYKKKFIEFWQKIDATLGNLLEMVKNNTLVFLVSDHGFGSNDEIFNLAKWLEMKGYLVRKKDFGEYMKKIINKSLHTLIPEPIRRIIPSKAREKVGDTLRTAITDEINFEESTAYCLGHTIPFGAIYINANNNKEKEEIKSKLLRDLQDISKDIKKDVKVQIYEPEKLYRGESRNLLPDIIFTIDNWRCVIVEDFNRPLFEERPFSTRHTGSHRLNGIFLAHGPGIKKGHKIENAKIYDIAPTILHIFGLPIPNDMDGRVLMEIFESDSEFAKRKPVYVDPRYYDKRSEEEKLKARIKELKLKGKI